MRELGLRARPVAVADDAPLPRLRRALRARDVDPGPRRVRARRYASAHRRRRQVLLPLPGRTLGPFFPLGRRVTRCMYRLPSRTARHAVHGRGLGGRVTAHRADQRTTLGPLLLCDLRLPRRNDLRSAVRTGHRHLGGRRNAVRAELGSGGVGLPLAPASADTSGHEQSVCGRSSAGGRLDEVGGMSPGLPCSSGSANWRRGTSRTTRM